MTRFSEMLNVYDDGDVSIHVVGSKEYEDKKNQIKGEMAEYQTEDKSLQFRCESAALQARLAIALVEIDALKDALGQAVKYGGMSRKDFSEMVDDMAKRAGEDEKIPDYIVLHK